MAFIIGAVIASFSYVVGIRLPKGQNWWSARSECPQCSAVLRWYELMPIVSFLWQRGRCQHCAAPIRIMYIIVEVIGGCVSTLFFKLYGMSFEWMLALCFLMFCLIVSVADSVYMIVPNRVLLVVGMPLCGLYSLHQALYSMIVGAIVGFSLLYSIHRFTGGIGAGDVKLMLILGAIVQIEQLFMCVSIACFIGFLLFFWKRQPVIPFAPALCSAALVTLYVKQLQWLTLY